MGLPADWSEVSFSVIVNLVLNEALQGLRRGRLIFWRLPSLNQLHYLHDVPHGITINTPSHDDAMSAK
jgi:hypothetical protein